MTTAFDSEVYQRRNATPCTRVDAAHLLRRLAWRADGKDVELTVHYRADVASRIWWTLKWKGADGKERIHCSQDFDLLLWRVATSEAHIDEEMKRRAREQSSGLPSAEDLDAVAEEQRIREATK